MIVRTLLALAAVVVACTACSSTEYIISTKEGRMLSAHGKPKYDEATGFYTYEDSEGRKATIRKDDVVEFLER